MTKAIRNMQFLNPKLKKKFPFISTLVCGHLKSKFYSDYLAWQKSIFPQELTNIDYRFKSSDHLASEYSTKLETNHLSQLVLHEDLRLNDWGLGLFKPKACDFCDDIFGELGDIVVGDAWLPEYTKDYQGTSIVITRSYKADELINGNKNQMTITSLSEKKIIKSQQGGVDHKRKGLFFRISNYLQNNYKIPTKRLYLLDSNLSPREKKKFLLRNILRIESINAYKIAIKANNLNLFFFYINKHVQAYYSASTRFYLIKKIIKFMIKIIK
jgi:coenzyme F420 hydrogenase subunit beta